MRSTVPIRSPKRALPGPEAPAAGFEVPLEMLAACHGRVQSQCETLLRLPPHLAAHGADTTAREAAQAVLRYFETSAKHHHADEEEDLFPALLDSANGPAHAELPALLEVLVAQHRELEQAWARLRLCLQAVLAGNAGLLDIAEVEDFARRYRAHIDLEEAQLLPLAQRLLATGQLDTIGRAMRARRGVRLD